METVTHGMENLNLNTNTNTNTNTTPPPTIWKKEQCEKYRNKILKRMSEKPHMTLNDDLPAKQFIFKTSDQPLSLYRTKRTLNYDMDDLKQSAFQQIGVICGCGEPMSMATIHTDFSLETEWNRTCNMPEDTQKLFSYIDANAEDLVNEMIQLGLLEHVVLNV
jgi:hypothetical protein